MPLKLCPYRQVDDDGQMLCRKIKTGDRAITSDDCMVCPIAHIDCSHLRATLVHAGHPPLLVRYGNGRTEVWHDPTPPLALEHAACAALVLPLDAPSACAGCARRAALGPPRLESRKARMPVVPATHPLPPAHGIPANATASAGPEPTTARPAASRIIQFAEWRARRVAAAAAAVPAQHPAAQSRH